MHRSLLVVLFLILWLPATASADTRKEYFDALKAAQAKVERAKQARELRAQSALVGETSLAPSLAPRHRVGDRWKVAAWSSDPNAMRHTSDPAALEKRSGRGAIFLYEVVRVAAGEVEIKVTQLEESGFTKIDARVDALTIAFKSGFAQERREYQLGGSSPRTFKASPEGMRAPVSYLELFPLEAPELSTAVRTAARELPEMPEPLRALWKSRGRALDLGQSEHIEQDDFFGRRIEAIWQAGQPWPTVLKTPHGTAILLEK
ncbi:MAG TPA: hypothetical protein VM598_04930 [Bdellovibrionota bacterium]|nr:hypothetical protein [Bdellovibrionota bacterium]